jgi:hypothetical protein
MPQTILKADDTSQNIEEILAHYNDLEELMDLIVGLLPAFVDSTRCDYSPECDREYLIHKINRIFQKDAVCLNT